MERRTCKLCFKSFSNGRALGGHMRSHMATLQPSPPPPPPPPPAAASASAATFAMENQLSKQLGNKIESASSSSASSSSSSSEEEEKGLSYGLRENPKKSFRLVDPEFSFAVDAGSVVQDRESETESSRNPSRRRSKRNRKSGVALLQHQHQHQHQQQEPKQKKPKLNKANNADSTVEPEPVSSVSDTTPEEDVARCLMMLSRGVWLRKKELVEEVEEEGGGEEEGEEEDEEEQEEEEEDEEVERSIDETDDDSEELKFCPNRVRGKYQCGTCKRMFRSYQALGGHRASHKKIRGCSAPFSLSATAARTTHEADNVAAGNAAVVARSNSVVAEDRRVHECPVCFRVFGSGQALGGHKRSHLFASATININHNANSTKFADNLIDLNLPAPIDEDDMSQVELSAVSDAEFVDPIK